jgi:hypothetical protein
MLVKTHDHVLAADDHRHAARTRDSDHFIQSVAVFADIKLNVLNSFSRKELLRLAFVAENSEGANAATGHYGVFRTVYVDLLTAAILSSGLSGSSVEKCICTHESDATSPTTFPIPMLEESLCSRNFSREVP